MTVNEFLTALRQCAGEFTWTMDPGSQYLLGRRTGTREKDFCPITAVAYAYERGEYGPWHWDVAARHLRVSLRDGTALVSAADGAIDHDPALRAQLLGAVGLVPGETHVC